jgi:membrane-associated phospholipid phosphatase
MRPADRTAKQICITAMLIMPAFDTLAEPAASHLQRIYSLMLNWMTFTKLADTVVMLPAAALCIAWLMLGRAWRLAVWWCALLMLGLTLVAASKIAFIGWALGIESLDFTGLSGHAMRASAIAPVFLYLLFQRTSAPVRLAAVLAGMGFSLLISVSRLLVNAHSVSEVVGGYLLGIVIGLAFIRRCVETRPCVLTPPLLVLGLLILVPAPMLEPAPTERWVQAMALQLSGRERPYTRVDWKTSPVPY